MVRFGSDEDKYVAAVGKGDGHLFGRVLGRVVHEVGAPVPPVHGAGGFACAWLP